MEFKDVDGYYLPAEVDKYVDEQQAEIDELQNLNIKRVNEIAWKGKEITDLEDANRELMDLLRSGVKHMPDITLTEIGEMSNKAWKEKAEKLLCKAR